jgi:diguanylate cyclase (GGDEF)-like protein
MLSLINRRVLVIDIVEDDRTFIRALLASSGYEVYCYPINGIDTCVDEIFSIYDNWRPEILLLDSSIPDLDACKLVSQLKSHVVYQHIPILILSNPTDGETYPVEIQQGADGFINKPLTYNELKTGLENLLQIKNCNDCYQSHHLQIRQQDFLTELPNRFAFQEHLKLACHVDPKPASMHVAIFDIDNFKRVNDTLGHSVGDILIKNIAERCAGVLCDRYFLAHMGAGSFALILECGKAEALLTLDSLHTQLSEPFVISDQEIHLTFSRGVARFPKDGKDWETLLKHTEIALYEAKQQGRDTHRFFDPEMDATLLRQFQIHADLRSAIKREEFYLVYQPQVAGPTGKVIGMEALIRWRHPVLGVLSPLEFIPMAEESDLICDIGDWVIKTACHANKLWQDQGILEARIAVNVSARQFRSGTIFNCVKSALYDSGMDPRFLELELTETLLMEQSDISSTTLKKLRDIGVTISIDDFGTGYSSLSYLKHFPIDQIKIDQSFVRNITSNSNDSAIARTIIGIATHLKREVIAEGVETEAQLRYLHQNNCHRYQGYLFSKPIPADEISEDFVDHYACVEQMYQSPNCIQRVLLVDADESSVQTFTKLFNDTPYQMSSVNNAEDAFDSLASEPTNIILCNQNLPTMSGTAFLKKAKDLHPNTLCIVLSEQADIDSILSSVNDGAIYKFLLKPLNKNELINNIEAAFHFLKLDKENQKLKKTLAQQ